MTPPSGNLIAEPDASEAAVTEAVNDTLKAIAASLLMEQVLAPRFEFKPKHPHNQATPGFDYGEGGYNPNKCNVGVNPESGLIQLEIKGLAAPKSQEAVRQHAIAVLNLVQHAAKKTIDEGGGEAAKNTSLIDGIRKFALSVTDLDIDLIDRINPFGEAFFDKVQCELKTGERQTLKYQDNADVKQGDLFILDGQKMIVVEMGDLFVNDHDCPDRRLRVFYDDAKKDPTYLLADVETVATFKLANINQKELEALLQKFFGSARLDLELIDRFGTPVKPREWFLVPLEVIEEISFLQFLNLGTHLLHVLPHQPLGGTFFFGRIAEQISWVENGHTQPPFPLNPFAAHFGNTSFTASDGLEGSGSSE
jgi:hypothetical protein